MNDIQIWDFQGNEVRTVEIDGVMWFVLADVCRVLELTNPSNVMQRLEDDEYTKLDLGYSNESIIVNEYGLYTVLIRSDKPKARPFRRWITHEVLPAIRDKGYYTIEKAEPAPTITSKAYAYLDIARMVSRCRTERLPLVMGLLEKGGWDMPAIEAAEQSGEIISTRDLSEKIRRVKDKYNLTMTAIADMVGENLTTMSRYFRRISFPRVDTYKELAKKLDDIYENGVNI